jgi:diguanylate cyclase
MNFSAMDNLLTNNHRFDSDDPVYRRVYLLNVILLFYIAFAVLFSILNAAAAAYLVTIIIAATGILCVILLIYFHKTDHLDICSYAVVILLFATMITMFTYTGQIHHMFVWISVFPPMVYFLLGRKKAMIATGLMLTYLLIFMLLNYKNWLAADFGTASIVNIMTSAIVLTLLISFFEMSRSEAVNAVQNKNRELEEANHALIENKDRLRLILDSTAEAVFGVDMECKCTFCNSSCLEILGFKHEEEILGKDIHELLHGKYRDGSPLPRNECNIIRTCMEGVTTHAEDEAFWNAYGASFDVEYNSYPQYKDGVLIGAVVTFIDNTMKKMHEQQTEYYSSHDFLTGLYNRNCFEYMLKKSDTFSNLPISVIMGDLNGLKLTNDVFGHAEGDELLIKAAEVIKKVCRDDDIVARLGGDEFVIFLPKTKYEDAMQIISRIKEVLGKEKTSVIKCSMSLGCDTKTTAAQNIDITTKNAENEMYKEKALNRNLTDTDMINAIIMSLYSKSPPEEQHSANVSEMCRAIGEELGLPQTEIKQLRNAGFLHDIGKVGIQESILQKRGEFTDQEEIEYRQHPAIGYRILNIFDSTVNLAEGVYSHHEQWNGTGYPRGLKGEEIPLIARIIAVAGRYETLLNRRGEKPVSTEEALEQIRADAGVILDPALVDVFLKIMTENPSGK